MTKIKLCTPQPFGVFKKALAGTLAFLMTASCVLDKTVVISKSRAAESSVMYGDVNSDGIISILDLISLKSYICEENSKGFTEKAADVDDDGLITAFDLSELTMYLTDRISTFSYVTKNDTDGDGICDYIETEITMTDYKSADTDKDGLTDYEEIYCCNTDPLVKDTVTSDMHDVDADGINNIDELAAGTDASDSDTDGDSLSDYDEINQYETDPLSQDSDTDGISDVGEITLGSDPLKDSSAETFKQSLKKGDKLLSTVNNEKSPYEVSIEVDAGGYIKESMTVCRSGYSQFLAGKAVLGEIIDVDYDDRFTVNSLSVSFTLKDASDPESFMIFRYDPETYMLLPVETTYSGSTLTFNDDSCGTYCVMDLTILSQENKIEYAPNQDESSKRISVMFVADGSLIYPSLSPYDWKIAEKVYQLSYKVFSKFDTPMSNIGINSTAYWTYNNIIAHNNTSFNGHTYLTDISDLNYIDIYYTFPLGNFPSGISDSYIEGSLYSPLYETIRNEKDCYYTSDQTFVFVITNENYNEGEYYIDKREANYCQADVEIKQCNGIEDIISKLKGIDNLSISYIVPNENSTTMIDKVKPYTEEFNGTIMYGTDDIDEEIIKFIGENIIVKSENQQPYFSNIEYSDSINKFWQVSGENKLTKFEEKLLCLPDSDIDGRCDAQEINWKMIDSKSNSLIFPDRYALSEKTESDLYKKGMNSLIEHCDKNGINIENYVHNPVLPLVSNIKSKDTDGDGYDDADDPSPEVTPLYLDGEYDYLDGEIYNIYFTSDKRYLENNSGISDFSQNNNSDNNKFRFEWTGRGYKISSLADKSKVLTVYLSSDDSSCVTGFVSYNPGDNAQLWEVVPYNKMLVLRSKQVSADGKSLYLSLNAGKISMSEVKGSNCTIDLTEITDWIRFGKLYMNRMGWIDSKISRSYEIFDNYLNNKAIGLGSDNMYSYLNPNTNQTNYVLLGQHIGTFSQSQPQLIYGHSEMKNVICEVIATYNALKINQSIADDSNYDEFFKLAAEFEMSGMLLPLVNGFFGSDPYKIQKCLNSYNVNYSKYDVVWASEYASDYAQMMDDDAVNSNSMIISYRFPALGDKIPIEKLKIHTISAIYDSKSGDLKVFNDNVYENKNTSESSIRGVTSLKTRTFYIGYILNGERT